MNVSAKAGAPRTGLPLQYNGNKRNYERATAEIVSFADDIIRTSTGVEWKTDDWGRIEDTTVTVE